MICVHYGITFFIGGTFFQGFLEPISEIQCVHKDIYQAEAGTNKQVT